MKYSFELLIAISLLVQNSEQKLPLCEVVTKKVCIKNPDYVAELEPIPLPNKIDTKIKFFEVIDVDETKHTVTLSMKIIVDWIDQRLDVNRSIDYRFVQCRYSKGERSLMTSLVFWPFLTNLPTLSYSIISLFWGYFGPPPT